MAVKFCFNWSVKPVLIPCGCGSVSVGSSLPLGGQAVQQSVLAARVSRLQPENQCCATISSFIFCTNPVLGAS